METKNILDKLMLKANSVEIDETNTYKNENGEVICRTCGKRKTMKLVLNGKSTFVNCVCNCDEEKQKEFERQEKERIKQEQFIRRQRLIDIGYRDIWFTDSDTELTKAINYVNEFRTMISDNVGLMLFGSVGTGKTFIASCIANELCKKGYEVVMIHTTEALNKIAKYDNEEFKYLIQHCDLLVLDDFGVSRNTDYQLEQLNSLIDLRYSCKKPLIITTNINRNDLASEKDIRLLRTFNRLIEMTHPIKLDGESRRKAISQERFNIIEKLLIGKE